MDSCDADAASDSQFMFEPALDASDEFQAAPFMATHGWYRQATAGLRNALEATATGAAFAVRNDITHYAAGGPENLRAKVRERGRVARGRFDTRRCRGSAWPAGAVRAKA